MKAKRTTEKYKHRSTALPCYRAALPARPYCPGVQLSNQVQPGAAEGGGAPQDRCPRHPGGAGADISAFCSAPALVPRSRQPPPVRAPPLMPPPGDPEGPATGTPPSIAPPGRRTAAAGAPSLPSSRYRGARSSPAFYRPSRRRSRGRRIMEAAAAGRTHRRQVACAGRDRAARRRRRGGRHPHRSRGAPRRHPRRAPGGGARPLCGAARRGRCVRRRGPGLRGQGVRGQGVCRPPGRSGDAGGPGPRAPGRAAPSSLSPSLPPAPPPLLTSPLPASAPQAARNRRRLMPMAAETWRAASKPGPTPAAGPPEPPEPGAAPPPPLPAAPPPEHGPPRSPSPAASGAAGSAARRLRTAGTRSRDPPSPRRPHPPLPGRAGKRHRPLCAIFTVRRRARERGRAAPPRPAYLVVGPQRSCIRI